MIKVFSYNKTLFFTDNKSLYTPHKASILVKIDSEKEIQKTYSELRNKQELDEIYFLSDEPQKTVKAFAEQFKIIEAAGGLVKNKDNKWLFIFRNGKWDLPKGKIEKNEKVKTAAIREVEEECGISKLSILHELPSTYHTYHLEEKEVLKRTYWFEMFCEDTSPLVPQLEEGITDVKWLAKNELQQVVDNTYASILDVLNALK
jgi:8-oxo-dGTP pyrophosphatase MutT (NUDIX family)